MIYINLNRNSSVSLRSQIHDSICNAILNGTLKAHEKLPSTRELAKELNISRNVTIESYEQLLAEGYLYAKNGSGTFVSEGIHLELKKQPNVIIQTTLESNKLINPYIYFRTGIPDLASIPVKKWGQIYKQITLDVESKDLDYQNSFGALELRQQLAQYLRRARGVQTTAEHILITTGAAQAFTLISKLVDDTNYALVENPLSYGILHTIESNHVKMKPIALDENGMITANLPELPPKLIFTTPSHQFPTGVILPAKRRIELIQYARKHNSYIVEDDYDSEFRFDGVPIQSMQNLDPEHVIYIGTFSKSLMPAMRLGYMVLPDKLISIMKEAKYIADLHSPMLEQLALSKFIEDGHFDLHIKKMRKLYLRRRNYLIQCLQEAFQDSVTISGANTGLHLVASFEGICYDDKIMNELQNQQVIITPVRKHYISEHKKISTPYDSVLIFGYGNTTCKQIKEGVQRLRLVINCM